MVASNDFDAALDSDYEFVVAADAESLSSDESEDDASIREPPVRDVQQADEPVVLLDEGHCADPVLGGLLDHAARLDGLQSLPNEPQPLLVDAPSPPLEATLPDVVLFEELAPPVQLGGSLAVSEERAAGAAAAAAALDATAVPGENRLVPAPDATAVPGKNHVVPQPHATAVPVESRHLVPELAASGGGQVEEQLAAAVLVAEAPGSAVCVPALQTSLTAAAPVVHAEADPASFEPGDVLKQSLAAMALTLCSEVKMALQAVKVVEQQGEQGEVLLADEGPAAKPSAAAHVSAAGATAADVLVANAAPALADEGTLADALTTAEAFAAASKVFNVSVANALAANATGANASAANATAANALVAASALTASQASRSCPPPAVKAATDPARVTSSTGKRASSDSWDKMPLPLKMFTVVLFVVLWCGSGHLTVKLVQGVWFFVFPVPLVVPPSPAPPVGSLQSACASVPAEWLAPPPHACAYDSANGADIPFGMPAASAASAAAAAEAEWLRDHVELEVRRVASLGKDAGGLLQLAATTSGPLHGRVLSMHIGEAETQAVLRHTGGVSIGGRPMTHDLLASAILAGGRRVARIDITQLRGDAFIANVHLASSDGTGGTSDGATAPGGAAGFAVETTVVDARPSDALNLAIRVGARMYASKRVMELASAA